MKKYKLGEVELRGDRIWLIHSFNGNKVEVDATPLWNFFLEVEEFKKQPLPPLKDKTI